MNRKDHKALTPTFDDLLMNKKQAKEIDKSTPSAPMAPS